jgi:hypothetical protein
MLILLSGEDNMGVLDALTILGSGIGQGYRGSQELQRQIAEAKRKALIEDRDMAIREQAQRSADALATAQATNLGSEASARDFTTGEAKAASLRGGAPITQGSPPAFSVGGRSFTIPNRFDALQDPSISALLRESGDEYIKGKYPQYFTNYPPAGTSAAQVKLDPRSRKVDYLLKAAGVATGGGPGQFEQPDVYQTRTAATFKYILDQLRAADPEAFNESAVPDTSGKGKGNKRFKIKVKP